MMLDSIQQLLEQAVADESALVWVLVFLGGVAASFTPCTYPVLPLTVGYIGNVAEGKKGKAFVLSLTLVIGMAAVYAVLGVTFAALRQPFGALQGNGPFLFGVALFFILMALFLLDVFTFRLPKSLAGLGGRERRKGLAGAFTVGVAGGLIVGPCTGPILAIVIGLVTVTLEEAHGAAYLWQIANGGAKLFLFGLGQGALILLCGTFSGLLGKLPKAGHWMNGIKKGFALLVILGASLLLLHAGNVTGFDPLSRFLVAAEGAAEEPSTNQDPVESTDFGGDEFLE